MKTSITNSFEQTQQLGIDFSKKLRGGTVLALHGDLGSGKTTFVQGLAKGLGIEQRIISPTFIIMRSYELSRHSGKRGTSASRISYRSNERDPGHGQAIGSEVIDREAQTESAQARRDDGLSVIKNLYHVDLYRIETERDVEGLGLLELMGDPENVVVIEWPEKIEHLLPQTRIDLSFEYVGDDTRRITYKD